MNQDIKSILNEVIVMKIGIEQSIRKLSEVMARLDVIDTFCTEYIKPPKTHSSACLKDRCECMDVRNHGFNCPQECLCNKMGVYLIIEEIYE